MKKAILFDFDGVIVDTEQEKFKFFKKELAILGIPLQEKDFSAFIGKKSACILEEFSISNHEKNALLKKWRDTQQKSIPPLIKEFLSTIEQLHNKKILLGIVTGTKNNLVKRILQHYNIEKYFSVHITGEDFIASKPNPECYNKALQKLKEINISPQETLIVEDSVAGITAAKGTNCTVVGITTYLTKEDLHLADHIINSHKDLLTII